MFRLVGDVMVATAFLSYSGPFNQDFLPCPILSCPVLPGYVFRLVGDVMVATAFLSYSGPFNQDFRLLLNKNWMKELKSRKIPFTANINISELLVDQTTVSSRGFFFFLVRCALFCQLRLGLRLEYYTLRLL